MNHTKHGVLVYIAFFLLSLLYIPHGVYAQKTYTVNSILVTDAREFYGNPYFPGGNLIFAGQASLNYHSGKVVVSGNPDGTGDIDVEESITISTGYPANKKFTYLAGCPHKRMPPLDITHLMWTGHFEAVTNIFLNIGKRGNCTQVREVNNVPVEYADISRMYVVHFDDYSPGPTPFLDLPWGYAAQKKSFAESSLDVTSYFDHEYPLLSVGLGLGEPESARDLIIPFNRSTRIKKNYSSHDGYDWARSAGVTFGQPVLAAGSGVATYVNTCGPCGNAVHIDHGNGYQTRYYHMQDDGLIGPAGVHVPVLKGQQIGKVGYTGNVDPPGQAGSHIHFMVIHDKNNDGNFEDNIPDGIIDPFGWQSDDPDPWEHYSFTYGGKSRTGDKSYYLWTTPITALAETLGVNGGTFIQDRYTINLPKNTVTTDTVLRMQSETPPENFVTATTLRQAIGNTVRVLISDGFGKYYTTFLKPLTLSFNLYGMDLMRYIPGSVAIYSSSDEGLTWNKEQTTLNTFTNTAQTTITHLSDFVVMGDKIDGIAPVTEASISGQLIAQQDQVVASTAIPTPTSPTPILPTDIPQISITTPVTDQSSATITPTPTPLPIETIKKYSSTVPVHIELIARDEPVVGSLGISRMMYKVEKDDRIVTDWTQYKESLVFNTTGAYTLSFFSADKDENEELPKEIRFVIAEEVIPTVTMTPTSTPTDTPTVAPTATPTETNTPTPTITPTYTPTPTPTDTPMPTPTITPSPTSTPIPTLTMTSTPTLTPTQMPTATPTTLPTATSRPTISTPTLTKSPTPSATPRTPAVSNAPTRFPKQSPTKEPAPTLKKVTPTPVKINPHGKDFELEFEDKNHIDDFITKWMRIVKSFFDSF